MPIPGPPRSADPEQIHADVDALLDSVDRIGNSGAAVGPDHSVTSGGFCGPEEPVLVQMAVLLEQAHDVLVAGLSTVDKA